MPRHKKQFYNLLPYKQQQNNIHNVEQTEDIKEEEEVEEGKEIEEEEEEEEGEEIEEEDEEEEEEEEENEGSVDDFDIALQYTIALIATGLTVARMMDFQILINQPYPSRKMITKAMNILRPYLFMLAKQSCATYKAKMGNEVTIAIDGSWNHRRHGTYEIFDVICCNTKKIIAFDIRIHKSKNIPGNTFATSSAMEGESFMKLLPELKQDPRIVSIVKDGDVQTGKMIDDSGWQVETKADMNHLMKHFDVQFKNLVPKEILPKFRGICPYIKDKLVIILYNNKHCKYQKLECMDNIQHTILHSNFLTYGKKEKLYAWKSRKDANCIQKLNLVIDYCKDLIMQFKRGETTNYNEAFHALKALLVPKNFNLGHSTDIRLYATILQYNEHDAWLKKVFAFFHLDTTCVEKLIEFRNQRRHEKTLHDFFQEKRNQQNAQNEEDRVQRQYENMHNIPHHV